MTEGLVQPVNFPTGTVMGGKTVFVLLQDAAGAYLAGEAHSACGTHTLVRRRSMTRKALWTKAFH